MQMQSCFSWESFNLIRIVIPGAEIPRFFGKQNGGNSICMDSSPFTRNQNWIGVACCFTFVTHDHPTNLIGPSFSCSMLCGFRHKTSNLVTNYGIPILFRKDLVTVEFDHLVLLYLSREEFIDSCLSYITRGTNDLEDFEFVTILNEQPQGLHVEVKMCGYQWVFEEDLDQLIHSMEHIGNSSVLEGNLLTNESLDELNHGKAA